MELCAELRIKGEKDTELVIRADFRGFDSESNILISNKGKKIEISLEGPVQEVIEVEEEKKESIETNAEKDAEETRDIPELSNLAIKAKSFEDFVDLVADWLRMRVDKDLFKQLVILASEQNKICLNKLIRSLETKEYKVKNISTKVSKALIGYSLTLIPFLKILVKYKDYDFTEESKVDADVAEWNSQIATIPELKEMVVRAVSFEDFVDLLSEWFNMRRKDDVFKNIIAAAIKMDGITLKKLKEALEKENSGYKFDSDYAYFCNKIAKKLGNNKITFLPFLKELVKYKDYDFSQKENFRSCEEEKTTETVRENFQTKKSEGNLQIDCLSKIEMFNEKLANLDKMQPIEDRVRYVLNAMGLYNLKKDKQEIFVKIATIVAERGNVDYNSIFDELKIPDEERRFIQMEFSTFVNEFSKKNGEEGNIKLKQFLLELKDVII